MKRSLLILLGAVFCVGAFTPMTSKAGIFIEVGDRGYYNRGPYYWEGGHRWVWVPGHWGPYHHHWYHGHYVRR